jgi:hypothetical protein
MPYNNPITNRATGYKVTATDWNGFGDNFEYLAEVAYAEFTADVAVTATAVGSANQIVSAGAIVYEAAPILIEFYCPQATQAAVQNFLLLRDGATVLGTISRFAASATAAPVYVQRRLTPTAASHTYNFAAWNAAAGTWTYQAGTGGTAGDATTDLPGFIRITRVPV